MLTYTIKQTKAFTVLHLSGKLTHKDHKTFADLISRIAAGGDRHVIIDVGALRHIDPSGFGMLVVAHETAAKHGGALRIRHASTTFKTLSAYIHTDQILAIS